MHLFPNTALIRLRVSCIIQSKIIHKPEVCIIAVTEGFVRQWTGTYLDLGGGSEDGVVWVFQTVLFKPLRLRADQQVKMCGQVASQQGFAGGDVEQEGESFHVEARLQHLECTQT